MSLRASVVIPTRDRAVILDRCLDALIEQIQEIGESEIVIIDDGSMDDTRDVVTAHSARSKASVRLVEMGATMGPAAARNRGVIEAKGRLVIFIGDDIIVRRGFLMQHLAMHSEFSGAKYAVLGHTTWHPDLEITPFMWWLERSGVQFEYERIERYGPTWQHLYTSNISFKRNFILREGLFDEAFRAAAFEDIDLGFRLARRGLRILYCPQAAAYHLHPNCVLDEAWIKRMQVRGYYEMLFKRKHPELSEASDADTGFWRRALLAATMDDKTIGIIKQAFYERQSSVGGSMSGWMEQFGASIFDSISSFCSCLGATSLMRELYPGFSTAAIHYGRAEEAERGNQRNRSFAEVIAAKRAEPGLNGFAFLAADFFAGHGAIHAAIRQYRDLLRVQPNHAYAQLRLAELLRQVGGDMDEIRRLYIASLDRGILKGDSRSLALIGLGLLEMADNSPRIALKWFERALNPLPDAPDLTAQALVHLAEGYNAIGKPDRAIQSLREASRIAARSAETRSLSSLLMAEIHSQRGHPERALRELRMAKSLSPPNAGLLIEIEFKTALAQLKLKRPQKVVPHLNRLHQMGAPSPFIRRIAFDGGLLMQAEGRLNEAEDFFRRAIEHSSNETEAGWAHYSLAETLIGQSRNAEAKEQLAGLTRGDLDAGLTASARERLALLFFEEGEYESALAQFEAAIHSMPSKRAREAHGIWMGILKCLKFLGRTEDALRFAFRLERKRTDDRHFIRELAFESGLLLQQRGRLRAAETRFKLAIEYSSNDLEAGWARYSLADVLLALKRPELALEQLRDAEGSSIPDDLLLLVREKTGMLFFKQGRFGEALEEFESALKIGAEEPEKRGWVYFNSARCLKELGKTALASRYYEKSQNLLTDPETIVASFWEHAHLTHKNQQDAGVLSQFEAGINSLLSEGKCSPDTAFRAVAILHGSRAFESASSLLKTLSKGIDLDRRFWRYALAYKRIGFLTSVEDMMSSLEFLPPSEQAEWHLSVASLLLEMSYDKDAEEEVRSALRLRENWPQANYLLGSILEKRRDFHEARARFEAVLEHEESVRRDLWSRIVGGAHYHLACILERMGDASLALKHLEACLRIVPRHQKAMELRLFLSSAPVAARS
ncbi:MAG: tetratricopeptide repeat protein [Candidatus Coatesbacteria bacterium]|nr:tetratricopeptide repeat protein [Candidatus Coatesbacteria bacterium]